MKSGKILKSRKLRYGSHSVLRAVIFAGILIFVVLIVQDNPWRLDVTQSKEFTPTKQTQKILRSVSVPIEIKAFYRPMSGEKSKAKDLLESYKYYCPKLNYEFIDPDRHPEIAKQYEVRLYGTVIVEGGGKTETVTNLDEGNLTNAIVKLVQRKRKIIYFLHGHGEVGISDFNKDGYSTVRRELEKENYLVKSLNLLRRTDVPSDASVVIIVGPRKGLLKGEIAALRKYINNGGNLCVMIDPFYNAGLEQFLRDYGIKISNDIVIDKLSKVFGGSYLMPVVTKYPDQRVTKNFNIATFFPECRSVEKTRNPPKNVHVALLALTSSGAWAERDLMSLREKHIASFNPNQDQAGPIPLVALSEVTPDHSKEMRMGKNNLGIKRDSAVREKGQLVVFGDTDFANNTYFGLSGNGDFFLNIVNYLAQRENLISIKRATQKGAPLILSRFQGRLLFFIPLVLIPLGVLILGIIVYRIRRRQR